MCITLWLAVTEIISGKISHKSILYRGGSSLWFKQRSLAPSGCLLLEVRAFVESVEAIRTTCCFHHCAQKNFGFLQTMFRGQEEFRLHLAAKSPQHTPPSATTSSEAEDGFIRLDASDANQSSTTVVPQLLVSQP